MSKAASATTPATAVDAPSGGRRVLDSLPSRARTTGQQAAARSRLIRRLRIGLPVLAIALISALVFSTRTKPVDEAFLDEFKDLGASTEELLMANPRFAGVDGKGKPFEITANFAKQDPGQRNIVELDAPKAVQGEADEASTVTASKGIYSSDSNILELTEDVQLEHKIGESIYVLRSPAATVSIEEETVTSNVGINGVGTDGGALKADKMTAHHVDGRIILEGNVSMRIYPKPNNTGEQTQSSETSNNQ